MPSPTAPMFLISLSYLKVLSKVWYMINKLKNVKALSTVCCSKKISNYCCFLLLSLPLLLITKYFSEKGARPQNHLFIFLIAKALKSSMNKWFLIKSNWNIFLPSRCFESEKRVILKAFYLLMSHKKFKQVTLSWKIQLMHFKSNPPPPRFPSWAKNLEVTTNSSVESFIQSDDMVIRLILPPYKTSLLKKKFVDLFITKTSV